MQQSNHIINFILERRKLTFSAEKCKVSKFGFTLSHSCSLAIGNENLEVVNSIRYLVDEFDSKGSYSTLCKTRVKKSLGTITELIPLCKEVNFGK